MHARLDLSNAYFRLVGNCTFGILCVTRLEAMDGLEMKCVLTIAKKHALNLGH
jgi:hypothetical protein